MGDPKDIRMVHFLCSRKFRGILCYIKKHTLFYSGDCRSIYGNDNFFQLDVLAYDPLELKMML